MIKLCYETVDNDFFDEYRKELDKLFKSEFEVTTEVFSDEATRVMAQSKELVGELLKSPKFIVKFDIVQLYSNCGASILSYIEVPYEISLVTYRRCMEIIDRCVFKCTNALHRTAVYYTNSVGASEVKALKNCGYEQIGRKWVNLNTNHMIITLLKIYDIDDPDEVCEGDPCDDCDGDCDECEYG